jgi:phosphopantetheine--protein transferase-like protein
MKFTKTDETHLYLMSLSELDGSCCHDVAVSLLSSQEKCVYDRVKAPCRRKEYLYGHYAARRILSRYVGMPAESLVIEPDKWGKPRLATPYGSEPGFNISHSADLLAIAVCPQGEIGVDVERVNQRMLFEVEAITRRHFSAAEQSIVANSPHTARVDEFFRLWTLKEATVKAMGAGFSIPLDEIDVASVPVRCHSGRHHEHEATGIDALHWDCLAAGYHVAVARLGKLGEVTVFDAAFPAERPFTAVQTHAGADSPVNPRSAQYQSGIGQRCRQRQDQAGSTS